MKTKPADGTVRAQPPRKPKTTTASAGRRSPPEKVASPNGAKTTFKGEVLRRAILDTAVKLFIERGTSGTSIQDIAESLGLTRTAVYYYFKKKEDILQSLSEEVTISARRQAGSVADRESIDPATALSDLVKQHASLILANPEGFRVIERNESDLSAKHVQSAQGARRGLFDNFRRVIERGIDSGQFRMVDSYVAAFSLIGMCNWTAWWYKPGGRLSVQQVVDAVADLALQSLCRDQSRILKNPTVQESLRLLHEDLALLERQLVPGSRKPLPSN